MYRIALCDDNLEYLKQLEAKVSDYFKIHEMQVTIQCFNESDMLMEYIEEQKLFDVYMLDVEMPGYSGIELARKVNEYGSQAYIILLIAYENYAVEGCELGLFRYLLKERLEDKLNVTMKDLFVRLNQKK